jgi:hypothetical protein
MKSLVVLFDKNTIFFNIPETIHPFTRQKDKHSPPSSSSSSHPKDKNTTQ